jgi:hypothetical protein
MRLRSVLLAAVSLACAAAPAMAATKAPAPKHHKAVVQKASLKRRLTPQHTDGVSVIMDEVRVVTFKRPVSTVFVGNPVIADATVIDPYHAFILGKAYGVTNLIALSAQSQTISNQQITVANRSGGVVTLNKGVAQFTYACTTAHCETNPRPGDQKAYFEDNSGSIGSHEEQSIKAASATAPGH